MQSVATAARSRALPWRKVLASSLLLWHLCSLDAPTIAVAWAALLGRQAGVHARVLIPQLEVLALGTWIVYVLDRVLDGIEDRDGRLLRLEERHYFHRRYRMVLLPLAALAALALVLLAKGLPRSLAEIYVVLALPVGVYAVAVHAELIARRTPWFGGRASTTGRGKAPVPGLGPSASTRAREDGQFRGRNWWIAHLRSTRVDALRRPDCGPYGTLRAATGIKEAAVAVLFTSAVAAPAIVASAPQQQAATRLSAVMLALLCWLNCATISHAEAPLFGRTKGPRANRRLMLYAVALGGFAGLQAIAIVSAPRPFSGIVHTNLAPAEAVFLSSLLLLTLVSEHAPRSGRRVRVLADLALLTPFLLLMLPLGS